MSWFAQLFGFREGQGNIHEQITVSGDKMTSRVNGATYTCGTFETPSLEQLRARGAANRLKERVAGELKVSIVAGDVSNFIAHYENRYALFQAASQFNCLEFPGPSVVPENGVTGYVGDRTQGPACSVACGPATVYRNYFVPLPLPPAAPPLLVTYDPSAQTHASSPAASTQSGKAKTQDHSANSQSAADNESGPKGQAGSESSSDSNDGSVSSSAGHDQAKAEQKAEAAAPKVQLGQSRSLQVENLKDICQLIENVPNGRYFTVRGGYTLATDQGLRLLNKKLQQLSEDAVMAKLRVGVHSDVQVTSRDWGRIQLRSNDHLVTQVFGSACSVSYSHESSGEMWAPFASLILKASYEATLWAALENACRHPEAPGSRTVYLTALGGGVFGNPMSWIADAMRRAFNIFRHTALDVRIVVYYSHYAEAELLALVRDFKRGASEREVVPLPVDPRGAPEKEVVLLPVDPRDARGSEDSSVPRSVDSSSDTDVEEPAVRFCSDNYCYQTWPCSEHAE